MVALAKGKLSYYVLSCLAERDMYGLELIEQIKQRFGIDIKLPSLYSNLNRLKELRFVSTYLKESNKGPKCSYSSITEKGRQELESLKATWEVDIEPLSSLSSEQDERLVSSPVLSADSQSSADDDYNEYFALPDDDEDSDEVESVGTQNDEALINNKEEIEKSKIESYSVQSEPEIKEETAPSFVDNAQEVKEISDLKEEYFQDTDADQHKDDYAQFTENKKLFDITQDFSKYKKRKSFTENQMVMNVKTAETPNEEKKQNDISSLRQTLQNSRDGNYEPIDRFAEKEKMEIQQEFSTTSQINANQSKQKERTDDGLFITDRIPQNEIPKAKKIETSKLSFTIQNDFSKMPAPKRDASLDPSCSDVKARLQKLYEKTATKKAEEPVKHGLREYETYEELKDYYAQQEIEFKPYDKPEGKIRHNTNKLLLFVEFVLFGISGTASALLYLIFNAAGGVNYDFSFLYYLFPVVAFVFVAYRFYDYKFGVSRVPRPMLKTTFLWAIFVLASIAIFCFSIICGLSLRSPVTYCTCIIYPIIILGIWFVARHYLTLYFYKRFWK